MFYNQSKFYVSFWTPFSLHFLFLLSCYNLSPFTVHQWKRERCFCTISEVDGTGTGPMFIMFDAMFLGSCSARSALLYSDSPSSKRILTILLTISGTYLYVFFSFFRHADQFLFCLWHIFWYLIEGSKWCSQMIFCFCTKSFSLFF